MRIFVILTIISLAFSQEKEFPTWTSYGKIGIDKFFKCHFTSLDVKSNKPSSKHFKKAVEFFDVLPEEILHVGDDKIADISGCMRAGLNALWFNNKSTNKKNYFLYSNACKFKNFFSFLFTSVPIKIVRV